MRQNRFFFQAEDGIRDHCVTGVHTCALPISPSLGRIDASRGRWSEQRLTGQPTRIASLRGCSESCLSPEWGRQDVARGVSPDRKSTRLNSSHTVISYAVFCLKKKKKQKRDID